MKSWGGSQMTGALSYRIYGSAPIRRLPNHTAPLDPRAIATAADVTRAISVAPSASTVASSGAPTRAASLCTPATSSCEAHGQAGTAATYWSQMDTTSARAGRILRRSSVPPSSQDGDSASAPSITKLTGKDTQIKILPRSRADRN